MEIAFRRLPTDPPFDVGPGEIVLRPGRTEHQARRTMALLAVECGLEGFVRGEGPVERVVIQADPTFDDMLAAAFVMRLLAGNRLPFRARDFATYAADTRAGRKTGDLPPKESLQGIYLAIRNQAGTDLTQPDAREQFLADWARMADAIFRWRTPSSRLRRPAGTPLKLRLFRNDPHFNRARAFLDRDQANYYDQDVSQGERCLMDLPGGPPEAAGLLLRHPPKSKLWKYWSREDPRAPGGNGYVFLGVFEEERHWRFSTKPESGTKLHELHQELQKAEEVKDPAATPRDPWYEGEHYNHTLVSAPHRGTVLSDEEVLGIVRRWTGARLVSCCKLPWKVAAALGGAIAAAIVIVVVLSLLNHPTGPDPDKRGAIRISPRAKPARVGPRKGTDYALLIATNRYDHWDNLNNAVSDAQTIAAVLQAKYGFQKPDLVIDKTKDEIQAAPDKYVLKKDYQDDDQLFIFLAGHGDFDPDRRRGFVVASDSLFRDPFRNSYIPHSTLRELIDNIRCKHILVVFDVCFGGTFDFGMATEANRGGGPYEEVSRDEFIARKMKPKTRRYLTSGGKTPVKDGKPGQHSPFAGKFIEALRKGDEEDESLADDLFRRVHKLPTEPRRGTFGSGTDPNGDFLFIQKKPMGIAPGRKEPPEHQKDNH